MKLLVAVSLIIGVASGASMYDTMKSLVSGGGYGSSGGGEYGEKCYPTYETKYKEQCEDYTEKVCYTTQRERCEDVQGKKCRAIQTSKHERKCFDVQELLCSLKENVEYEEVPAVFSVQKCQKITERVCDTAYDTKFSERDDFKCINIMNPYCALKDHTVHDKTCRTVVHFDCKASSYGGEAASYSNSYGQDSQDSYARGSQDSYGVSSYGDSSYEQEVKCKRTPETKCYTTPRTVSSEYCEDRNEKVCEKLTERFPVPNEHQNCHDEHKKVCELEQRSQPKQVKKYVYTKQCRPVSKTICDNAEQKSLQPSCVPSSRKECSYHPEEKCDNVPKQHCYKIPYQVKKMECSKGYESDTSYGSDAAYGQTESYAKDESTDY